ncbi:MAG TPA: DNA-binding domain-containing protein [Rubrivivax sp.]|nr:DNA-binding domain-containing protein [Rubrivivax sp.]
MSGALQRFQAQFFEALFDRDSASALNAQPAFAVYRNTVISGCVDALQANFPSVARLVGPQWFRAAAAAYLQRHPPSEGRLLNYGECFADFLAGFEPARDWPYLAGVARLDRWWIESHTADDADALAAASLAPLPPIELGTLRLAPHPAARWGWFDDAPIYSIWQRNRSAEAPLGGELVWQAEGALLTRPLDAVEWHRVERCDCAFLDACAQHRPLGVAAAAAMQAEPQADIAGLLARLLRSGALARSAFEEDPA